MRKINQRDYVAWVVVDGKIESGWEYAEDAKEQAKDNLPPGKGKVLGRVGLKRLGLDPDNNDDWMMGNMGSKAASELLKMARSLLSSSILPSDSAVPTDGGKPHSYDFPTDSHLHRDMEEIDAVNQQRNDITGLAAASKVPGDEGEAGATVGEQNGGYGSLSPTGQGIMETGRIAARVADFAIRQACIGHRI